MAALLALAVIGLIELICAASSLAPSLSGRKDFVQEYLMAKAAISGIDPYLPLPVLGEMFPLPCNPRLFPHSSAHPPFMAIVGLPFALISYPWAAGAWFVLCVLLIALSCFLLVRWLALPDAALVTALASLAIFLWEPAFDELIFGQLNSLQLVLLISAWLLLRQGKDVSGGIFLGLAVSIKLLSWPLALFLLMQRRWRGVIATGITAGMANLAALLLVGSDPFWKYYTTTGNLVWPYWRAHEANFSMWSVGWRLFNGSHGRGPTMNLIEPVYASPEFAGLVSIIFPILLLLTTLHVSLRMRQFDSAFGLTLCASLLLSPVSWSHYLLLTLLPVTVAAHMLTREEFRLPGLRPIRLFSLLTAIMLVAPGPETRDLMRLVESHQTVGINGSVTHHIPFAAGLVSLLPMVAVLCLMSLLWMLDKVVATERSSPDSQQVTQHLQ